jgi:hexosaminidase
MNRHFFSLLLSLIASSAFALNEPAIIPLPKSIERREGFFSRRGGAIDAGPGGAKAARFLVAELHARSRGEFHTASTLDSVIAIELRLVQSQSSPESYDLTVNPGRIIIEAPDQAGLFYGAQTLLQLVPSDASTAGTGSQIQCLHIQDQPRFSWRGLELDVARHFFNKQEIKQLLDEMAMYKLNTFHWHLVDDQGWRIEIKKYPKLTQMGAWRQNVGFGLDPKKATAFGSDGRYGGFYTQDDIREVVAYAKSRHINIVPEIEMPGHSCAALMAYPQFSCTGGPFTNDLPGGIFDGVFCAGNDGSFKFMEDVLTEVMDLFPGKYIHIGGDEVLTNNWKNCPKCQARMKKEGLHHEMELESYFIRRIEKVINAHERRLIGWSEIREGGLARNATIMDWAGGAIEAATSGHDVVMSPLNDCYFDHYQSKDIANEPHAIGGYLPLEQVYAFEPIPAKLAPQFRRHILGAQANVWTEYMPSFSHVQYMIFPRICAMAEVVWSPREARDWDSFSRRLETHYKLFDQLGINYRHPSAPTQQASSDK